MDTLDLAQQAIDIVDDLRNARLSYYSEYLPLREALDTLVEFKEVTQQLAAGEWVEASRVQEALGFSFNQCLKCFTHSRISEWWSVVGKTPEERAREGQKIVNYFKISSR